MHAVPEVETSWYGRSFDEIDRELASLAVTCQVDLFDEVVRERVLNNDPSVCACPNRAAFNKLRYLLMMHYAVRTRAVEVLGEEATQALVDDVMERIRRRLRSR